MAGIAGGRLMRRWAAKGAVGVLAAGLSTQALAEPNLAGKWTRNPALSQDWQARLDAAAPVSDFWKQADRAAQRKFISYVLEASSELEITQTAEEVKLANAADDVQIFYFGRKHKRQGATGVMIDSSITWQADVLVITQEMEDGTKVLVNLTLDEAGKQLVAVIRWENKHLAEPLLVRSVYDRLP
jgi:hypothetical protein